MNSVELAMVHSAAALLVRLEQTQEALVAGEDVDTDRMVRLSSKARRVLTILRRRKGQKSHFQGADPLSDYRSWADAT